MKTNQPKYETMPEHYLLCFNDKCPLADSCLHRLAEQSGQQKDDLVWAVNPNRNSEENCKYYQENKVVSMAYGMTDSFHDVKADDIANLRNTLISHFGRGSYYLRRNGKRPITPEEQRYIARVFQRFGYEVSFDRMEEETQWL
jgi:hypothetical protein